MYYLKTSSAFDSAHFLSGYDGKCKNIHGHRWVIEVKIKGQELQKTGNEKGMLTDFGNLKKTVRDLAESFDHSFIYEKNTLKPSTIQALNDEDFRLIEVPFRPTAENFAHYFYDILSGEGFELADVTVYETPDNCAVYEGAC
ncbi:MAG: 6-carboxytetrahydropterin synthase QueD [Ruminococcus sp.]|nr:6-carboxytetrahydropterin synthase QueD [Ruminococcus sp.]MDE6672071.1 6-carboxytetrahydropterin synthase QueD [Ruminococcus sp.]